MWEYNYGPNVQEDRLAHYGVIGMKWGRRRSPQQQAFRAEVKAYKKRGMTSDTVTYDDYGGRSKTTKSNSHHISSYNVGGKITGNTKVTQLYNSKGVKIGREEAAKIVRQGEKEKNMQSLAVTGAIAAGMTAAILILGKDPVR